MFNLPTTAIKALDSLLEHLQEETVEPIEESIKGLKKNFKAGNYLCLLYTSPSPRDATLSRMPSSA